MVVIKKLVWDEWNTNHIARHGVTRDEVDHACKSKYIDRDGKKGRLIVVGTTKQSRVLAIILDPEPEEGVYYPVTAHTASRKLRRIYKAQKGGETQNDKAA